MDLATLGPETFGERLHRAYRRAKEEYGITYQEIADQITKLGYPVSQQSVFRVEELETVPRTARKQMLVYLFVLAIGFDPAGFSGLKRPMAGMMDWDKAAEELHPSRWKRQIAPSRVRSRCDSQSSAAHTPTRGLAS